MLMLPSFPRKPVIPTQAIFVIPAKAGIHVARPNVDPRFRGDDGNVAGMTECREDDGLSRDDDHGFIPA